MELSKRYQPAQVEGELYSFWEEGDFFRAKLDQRRTKPFSIVIPPPNITGRLHLGHALNNTLQDIVIRQKRMDGHAACWFPGTDHAGIATQNVVEQVLAKEGTSRHEIGRDAFVDRVWQWKEKYGSEIIEQLKSLGCSCDWSRQRFTLDQGLSRAVRQAFLQLHDEGLIYQGDYMINWCPRCETALSDIEVEHHEIEGNLYYVRYPLQDDGHVTIATTRPETMLGDTGVAVNPNDERYQGLIGKTAILPILERRLPIVGAEEVDPEFGTGVLKITPAHDPTDFEIGKRCGLDTLNILNGDGTINDNGGPFASMDRDQARQAVVKRLQEEDLLEKVVPYQHAVGHCQRCGTAVEPLISNQWFVRMKPLAEPAIEAVRAGRIQFVPQRWTKVYFEWLENIRDWCISRQLWWGHRIPVWYGPDGAAFAAQDSSAAHAQALAHCGREVDLHQEDDVLDTWFSSSLWPFSIMGWPDDSDDLRCFYPTSLLVTAFDILFFWVARMVMMGLHFMGDIPFHKVYITPLIVDEKGRKMSKSSGNIIDPMEVKETYGMDALRFTLARSTSKGRSMRFSESQLAEARNFLNKIWNMARFILMALDEQRPELPDEATELEDRFILSRLADTIETIRTNLDAYNFNLAGESLYAFIWHDFCDWYLELAKVRLASTNEVAVKGILYYVLKEILKLLHPFVPYISEAIWQVLGEHPASLSIASYPRPGSRDDEAEADMAAFQEVVSGVRTVRAELNVPQKARPEVLVRTADPELTELLRRKVEALHALAGTSALQVGEDLRAPAGSARQILTDAELFVPLAELIDVDAERSRLHKELSQVRTELAKTESKLADSSFLQRAPADVVEKERRKKAEFATRHERLQANFVALGG